MAYPCETPAGIPVVHGWPAQHCSGQNGIRIISKLLHQTHGGSSLDLARADFSICVLQSIFLSDIFPSLRRWIASFRFFLSLNSFRGHLQIFRYFRIKCGIISSFYWYSLCCKRVRRNEPSEFPIPCIFLSSKVCSASSGNGINDFQISGNQCRGDREKLFMISRVHAKPLGKVTPSVY